MKKVKIPIIIEMVLDEVQDLTDAKLQVASILYDDPSIIEATVMEVPDNSITIEDFTP